ncbi:hypothetical protein [Pseudophaeobacter sp.]|uniref:hypothetical protein n=1 Tax=Pseudophaeobacter sp. TaxID=1971739 RepID=UPI00329A6809
MSRPLALFAIGLVFGGGIGFVTAAGNGVTFTGHDHSDPAQHGTSAEQHAAMGHAEQHGAAGQKAELAAHNHTKAINFPAGPEAPGLEVAVIKDRMAGWNLQVVPHNFRFAPENASSLDNPGEGHAHVYVNGSKLARLYGTWMHLSELPKGKVEVKVSLNTNSHSTLTVDGKAVDASVTVDNP